MKKIKVLIAHSSPKVKKELRKSIENIEYTIIVDEVTTGKEVLDAVLKYEPNIVFTKYNMLDIDMVDVIEMTERVLQEKVPAFKFISESLDKTINAKYDVKEDKSSKTEVYVKEYGKEDIVNFIEEYAKKCA